MATVISHNIHDEALLLAHDRAIMRQRLATLHGNKHPVFIVPLKRHDKPGAFFAPPYKRLPKNAIQIKHDA